MGRSLRPPVILIENVPEFAGWGPIGTNNQPLKSKKGEIFRAWCAALESCGYRVDYRVLCAADYGDPTTRRRLFIQAVRGRRQIVWPDPTHAPSHEATLFNRRPYRVARDIIDWSLKGESVFTRRRPLADNTIRRINEGLHKFGSPVIIAMEHGGRAVSSKQPLPTVTTAKGGAFGVAYVLPQQSGGRLRPVSKPLPTVSTAGAISLIVEYYGNGIARPVSEPLPTVTCNDRFALIRATGGDVLFRMLQPHELAAAQGFPSEYKFTGTKVQVVKQIGNAVPCGLARALVLSVMSQSNDISKYIKKGKAA